MEREQQIYSRGLNRRAVVRLLAFGSATALLAACGPAVQPESTPVSAPANAAVPTASGPAPTRAPAAGAPTSGGTLNVAIADLGTENNDVILAQPNNPQYVIFEPLLRYDPQGNIVPWLAESFEMSPDGRLWTFTLRKGMKWHNGDEITSDDIKFTFERYVSDASKSAWSPLHRQTVDHIETPDKYVAQVYAKDPPYVFYPDAVYGTMLTPKKYIESVGVDTFGKQPVASGPWKLTNLTPGVSAEFEAFQDYWGTKPVWDKLVLKQVPEESTRVAMIKRGEVDIVGVSADNAIQLRDSGGFQLRQTRASTTPALFMAGYWMQPGPTSDPRVREAMDIAINRQELVDSLFRGFGKPAAGTLQLTDLHWGFDPIWYSIKYEPDRAKQLLKDAGYPDKFTDPSIAVFSVTQASFGWEPDMLQVISGYWEAVGIKTQLVPMDFTAFRNAWVAKDPKIMGGVATYIAFGAAANTIPAQQNHMTSKGVNFSGNDPQVDSDFFAMVGELDASKRLELWHKVQQEMFALHSVQGVARVYDQYAVSDKVGDWTGLDYLPNGFLIGLAGVQHR
jgi:peptide/nickel transport system substrate-binding protein